MPKRKVLVIHGLTTEEMERLGLSPGALAEIDANDVIAMRGGRRPVIWICPKCDHANELAECECTNCGFEHCE